MLLKKRTKPRIGGPAVEEPHESPGPAEGPTVDMEMRGGSFRQKLKWYQKIWKRDTVTLETLSWDGQRYILKRCTLSRSELPTEAVHVTGKSGYWFMDAVDPETRDDLKVVYDPSYKVPDAIDVHLYAINNAFNEALMIRGRTAPKDIKRIVTIVMVAAVAACVAWVFIGPMFRRLSMERTRSFLVFCRQST